MKKVTLFLLVFLFFSTVKAQKVYFVYLQSENGQPFYARMGEKVYNSSASGYLILSKLRDSAYTMNIGLQGSQASDQPYSIIVNRKDQGYLLKNFGDKGWGLFSLQTMAVIMPSVNNAGNIVKTEKREANAFTDLLAKAADDSTLKEKPVIVKVEEKKAEEPVHQVEKKEDPKQEVSDTIAARVDETKKEPQVEKKEEPKTEIKEPALAKSEESKVETKTKEKTPEEVYKKSIITRRSESSTSEGFSITFFDVYSDGKTDTVKILIPNEAKKVLPADVKTEEKKFLEIIPADTIQKQPDEEKKEVVSQPASRQEAPKLQVVKKNNCPQSASEDDFFRLRKKMAGESNDDNMINEAKKAFKVKCFSAQQLKNLSTMFLTDEGKYKFFDAAYTYISDIENFSFLQSELKDEYYISRFKAILR